MSIDPRRTQPFPTCTCLNKSCRCSRWPGYLNRWGLPVAGGEETYDDKVLATGPIAYWPQSETAGVTAVNYGTLGTAANGTYTGVTLANDNTGPFGTPAPLFDGLTSYNNINTAALKAALNAGAAELSIGAWFRVFNVGVWTDGLSASVVSLWDDANNRIVTQKAAANDSVYTYWIGGGVLEDHTENPVTSTDWMFSVTTRSEAADEVRYYRNGTPLAVDTIIGNWVAANLWPRMVIGASTTAPNGPFPGWIGPCAIWDRAITPAEVAALAL